MDVEPIEMEGWLYLHNSWNFKSSQHFLKLFALETVLFFDCVCSTMYVSEKSYRAVKILLDTSVL